MPASHAGCESSAPQKLDLVTEHFDPPSFPFDADPSFLHPRLLSYSCSSVSLVSTQRLSFFTFIRSPPVTQKKSGSIWREALPFAGDTQSEQLLVKAGRSTSFDRIGTLSCATRACTSELGTDGEGATYQRHLLLPRRLAQEVSVSLLPSSRLIPKAKPRSDLACSIAPASCTYRRRAAEQLRNLVRHLL